VIRAGWPWPWPQALQSVTGTWLRPLLTTQCSHVRVALSESSWTLQPKGTSVSGAVPSTHASLRNGLLALELANGFTHLPTPWARRCLTSRPPSGVITTSAGSYAGRHP
jgi:hypothetical protein